jgi:hypothetical protein
VSAADLEAQIAGWRAYLAGSPALHGHDLEELESHLRDQIAELGDAGLSCDEAFLIAVNRMGDIDALSREFAREHSGRLWRQLVLAGRPEDEQVTGDGLALAVVLAIGAAATFQTAWLLTDWSSDGVPWLLRNASLLVLPFLAAYFARRRQLTPRQWVWAALAFVVAAMVVNLYPFDPGSSSSELLVVTHLPVVAWFIVAYPYMGGGLRSHERRMDVVRFTGEWFIYYVLLALGGGVLTGLTVAILAPAGLDADRIGEWVLPAGAAGAVVIAAWLVESKQRVVENMAPVLTMVFTPLFAVMLSASLGVYVVTGLGEAFDRELLALFDALLVVVLGLVLYATSARQPAQPPGWMDRIQLVAIVAALVLNAMVLGTMATRIGELGFTPNRATALGLNLVLLVNLGGAAGLSFRFLTGRDTFHRLERWQTSYLPVFAVWAATVVVVLPLVFSFA